MFSDGKKPQIWVRSRGGRRVRPRRLWRDLEHHIVSRAVEVAFAVQKQSAQRLSAVGPVEPVQDGIFPLAVHARRQLVYHATAPGASPDAAGNGRTIQIASLSMITAPVGKLPFFGFGKACRTVCFPMPAPRWCQPENSAALSFPTGIAPAFRRGAVKIV